MESTKHSNNRLSRRTFIRDSLLAAGTVAGALAGGGCASSEPSKSVVQPKILNHNPNMGYRRLGKTGLVISEVGLGGHWKDRQGNRYWDEFTDEKVPADVIENRTAVIDACIDAGVNYLDIGTSAECLAYGVVLKGRRDRMIIGADDYKLTAREPGNCRVDKFMFDIEQCCRRLQTDYIDIWRVKADMYGRTTDAHVSAIIEAFQKAHKAGKVRYLGISSHRRPWLQHVIETFDEVQVVSFPCTARTKDKGKGPANDNIEEVSAGYDADITQSIFQSVRERDVGVVAIKPFLGGNLFASYGQDKFPVTHPGSKQEHDLARLTLKCILVNAQVTTTIPGLTTVQELKNAVRASYERKLSLTDLEKRWLWQTTERRWAKLPREYAWLR
ncbi:MAG: aldo/keto reductase, partial [Planctomycetota bacterium]